MTSFSNLPDKGVMERKRGWEGKQRGRDGDEKEEGRARGGERKGERGGQKGSPGCRTHFVEDDCLKRLNAFPYKDGEVLI